MAVTPQTAASRLLRVGATFDTIATPAFAAAATAIRDRALPAFRAATPEDRDPPPGSLRLRDRTDAAAPLTSARGGEVIVTQDKTIEIDGTAVPLWQVLTRGKRGDYDVSPVNADALRWVENGAWHGPFPHTHPMRAAKPNPYIRDTTVELLPQLRGTLRTAGQGIMRGFLKTLAS